MPLPQCLLKLADEFFMLFPGQNTVSFAFAGRLMHMLHLVNVHHTYSTCLTYIHVCYVRTVWLFDVAGAGAGADGAARNEN